MSLSQWQRIAEHYRLRIEKGDLQPGDRIPSDARLAEEWGVSRPTAHRALHELQRLGLVARSKGSGTVVAEQVAKATNRVALIVDRMVPRVNFPSSDLLRGIQAGFGEDVSLVVAQCDDDPEREARQLERLSGEVDALILYPTSHPENNAIIQRIFDGGTPLVVLDRFPEGLNVDTVVSDNRGATVRSLQALQQAGHRRIAFFSFHKPDFSSVRERYDAYRETVGDEVAVETTRWFLPMLENHPRLMVQAIQDAVAVLTQGSDPVTAIFCVEDILAAGVVEACECLEIRLPSDLEIAFFNDWPAMMLRSPWGMHRIVQNAYELGRAAAELARRRLEGEVGEPRLHRVPADLLPAEAVLPGKALLDFPSLTNGGY